MGDNLIVGNATGVAPTGGVTLEPVAVTGTGVNGAGGVLGSSDTGLGVSASSKTGNALDAISISANGVAGISLTSGIGVSGTSKSGDGVFGSSNSGNGVHGESASSGGSAVAGINSAGGHGVYGTSASGHGVRGINGPASGGTPARISGVWGDSIGNYGVLGTSTSSDGVHGSSTSGNGVAGEAAAPGLSAVAGIHSGNGHGIYGRSAVGQAGYFDGNVTVTGNITSTDVIVTGADCAEEFDTLCSDEIKAGMVVVFNKDGRLSPSKEPYDRCVAGVISGAGSFKPGVVLDRRATNQIRVPVALVGKVYCKADASDGPISVGDLLTTSATSGHAMRAQDSSRAFGAVIGKALGSLQEGTGLIPILVAIG